jgi:anaerobic selenocysteine-containing dehydrogenase
MVAPFATTVEQSPEELHHEISTLAGLYTETGSHEGYYRMSRVKSRLPFSDKPATFATVVPEVVSAPDAAYPFSLTVGPVLHHNGSLTLWSENNLNVAGQGYVLINPADAAKAGIAAGAIAKISSGVGTVSLPAQLSCSVQAGALFIPSHFRESQPGLLLKGAANSVAVRLEKA